MVDYIRSTCRICLMEGNQKVSIFETQNIASQNTYSELMKEYTGLEVVQNVNLPTSICEICSSELKVLIKFVSKFKTSRAKLESVHPIKVIENPVKDEDDLPLSAMNSAIKDETIYSDVDDSCDGFFPNDPSDDDQPKQLSKLNYAIVKSGEYNLKKDMVQCLTCGLFVQNISAFKVHYRKHSGEKPCKCVQCGKRFTQIGSLNDHIKRNHLREGHELSEALAETVKKMRIKGKLNEYRFTCDACGKRFWKKGALTIHSRVHTGEKPYQCIYCPKRFAQYTEHRQHTRVHTGEKPFSCQICGKTFIAHTPLRRHLAVHSEERKYKCKMCDTAVKSSDSLKKHILVTHTTEKQNVCKLCGTAFALKYNLKAHMHARHSERSGECEHCKKSFSNLAKHMVTHLAEKPFGCLKCSKRFFRQKGLTAHMEKHQNEVTVFGCSYENCNSAFTKQCKLNFHILKYHSDHTPHVCSFCSKGFYRLGDLRKHLKFNHDEGLPSDPIYALNQENPTSTVNGVS